MSNNVEQLDLFMGTKRSYENYKRDNNVHTPVDEDEEPEEEKNVPESTVRVLSKSTLNSISEDMLKILKRTRCAHDYTEVYMQPLLEFYDEFYNNTEISEELKEARQIRRVYKNYSDYLNAIAIRDRYIDTLIEKYGGEEEFEKKLTLGFINDWIPQTPTLSKKSEDYELFLSGMMPNRRDVEPPTAEEYQEVLDAMLEDMGDDLPEFVAGIETSIGIVNDYIERGYSDLPFSNSRYDNTVTINDLEGLNKIFKSWYNPNDDNVSPKHELFKNAPENIMKRYREYCAFDEPGLLTHLANGGEIEEPPLDPNEMVYDEVTSRNMTRKELEQRQLIRLMEENGWSSTRLMNYNNVGSSLERMSRKKKARKKRGKRPASDKFYNEINLPSSIDPMYSDNDYLSKAFMDLMSGGVDY